MILLICTLTGCGASDTNTLNQTDSQNRINNEAATNQNLFAEKDTKINKLGAFSFGIRAKNYEKQIYEYNGDELNIPFSVAGVEENSQSNFGLMVFIDGVPQEYKISYKDGNDEKYQYMHKFSLKNKELKEFDMVINPSVGKKGERLGIVFSTILNPDFMPEYKKTTNYGIYHNLNATVAQEVYFTRDASRNNNDDYNMYSLKELPKPKKETYGIIVSENNNLDNVLKTEIVTKDSKNDVLIAENGKIKFDLNIYGGQEAIYRTVLFINHKPVSVMNSESILTKTKKGKMCSVTIELDTSKYNKFNTIYAITNPVGKDYMAVRDYPKKARSILLVNSTTKNLYQNLHVDKSRDTLILKDDQTDQIIKKIFIKKNYFAKAVHTLNNGYVAEIVKGDKPKDKIIGDGIEITLMHEKYTSRTFQFFDSMLNLKKEIFAYKNIPEEILNEAQQTIISDDGRYLAWIYRSQIYLFDFETNKYEKLINDNNLYFSSINFMKNNSQIAFCGDNSTLPEGDSIFGFININNKKISYHVSKSHSANSIFTTSNYTCYCDYIRPETQSSSGKVIVIDTLKNKKYEIKVNGIDSTFARMSNKGNILLTVRKINNSKFKICQYKISNNKKVKDTILDFKKGELEAVDLDYVDFDKYALFCVEKGRLRIEYFKCED